jgi:predicted nucleotidyltransferase
MLTKKQIQLLSILKPFREYTRKQIKEISKESSNNLIQIALINLKQQNILKEKKVGKSSLFSLNLNNLTKTYLSLANQESLTKQTKQTINILTEEIEKYVSFYSIVIFGSYAENKQRKHSDLDVAIIIKDKIQKTNMKLAINSTKNKSLQKLDIHVISKIEFKEMLNQEEENLGKQILENHKVINNPNIFYSLIK